MVNRELVNLYWGTGQLVVARQRTEGWGKTIMQRLATDLQASLPGTGDFSVSNLWRMKGFFETYCSAAKLAPLVRGIGWSRNLLILECCKDAQEREFCLRMTRKFGWSKNVLAHRIDNQSYKKSLLGQTSFDRALTSALRAQTELVVRGEYAFDFLRLGDRHSERELECTFITRIEDFLYVVGGVLAFLGSQCRLEVNGDEYFIGLLPFYRRSYSLVAIELKIGKFEPGSVGKVQFYLAALGEQIRRDDENPSIGIILCEGKKRTTVGYTLRDARKPTGVVTYVITKGLPEEPQGQLSSPEAIARLLETLQPRPLKTGRHDRLARPVIIAF